MRICEEHYNSGSDSMLKKSRVDRWVVHIDKFIQGLEETFQFGQSRYNFEIYFAVCFNEDNIVS